jgi:hypothetical protein
MGFGPIYLHVDAGTQSEHGDLILARIERGIQQELGISGDRDIVRELIAVKRLQCGLVREPCDSWIIPRRCKSQEVSIAREVIQKPAAHGHCQSKILNTWRGHRTAQIGPEKCRKINGHEIRF